ncbi:hypothetical protein CLOP_g20800 [Closterium sp. NIES-67]|nr:hypothetical protein CLOP_g20800 [Closterium sp. NIES-67]
MTANLEGSFASSSGDNCWAAWGWVSSGARVLCKRLDPRPLDLGDGLWGTAYRERSATIEVMGQLLAVDDDTRKLKWWKAQSVRFMLRWPSPHLCHLVNRERHQVYGLHVARTVASAVARRQQLVNSSFAAAQALGFDLSGQSSLQKGSTWQQGLGEGSRLGQVGTTWASSCTSNGSNRNETSEISSSHSSSSRMNGTSHTSNSSSSSSSSSGLLQLAFLSGAIEAAVGWEVYMPRPIVSVHVRQGDKSRWMGAISLASYVFEANRFRRVDPALHYVWLSTEMESVVTGSKQFHQWTFFYSTLPRQRGNEKMSLYLRVNLPRMIGASFVNLLLSSECDYFVGVLASNWNQLIDELRSTNGRLFAGYLALNHGEW